MMSVVQLHGVCRLCSYIVSVVQLYDVGLQLYGLSVVQLYGVSYLCSYMVSVGCAAI